ncbi:hypothetical protein PPERSA_08977 [Pseudocohnilembus persalinus]|uniref:Uncharacterized protein n=1 Tax=Pseudocohnilembus persalinus TaxID=266149 RepID=A0A0V0R2Y6_PSEPJ|nr:hypothetical protein PPERSA_08977 [Pseudocohnilembus persalinus]|eukprot:KRX08873.1 hypothetical protein PPERSA_08977 [Pseudocohnilembus persalinus]
MSLTGQIKVFLDGAHFLLEFLQKYLNFSEMIKKEQKKEELADFPQKKGLKKTQRNEDQKKKIKRSYYVKFQLDKLVRIVQFDFSNFLEAKLSLGQGFLGGEW